MSSKFWKWNNSVDSVNSELVLEGPISEESWWGDEVTPQEFRDELNQHKGDLMVVLNSGGGDVFAGMAIYNALREFDGDVTVRVDGLAASIASVVAMAADKVIMAPGSMMMIHKPWTMVVGDTNDLDKTKEILQGIEDSIVPIYQSRTGLGKEEITSMLEAETWLTADQAVEQGFADEAVEAKQKFTISDAIKNALNGEFAFSMSATKKSLQDFVAKVKADVTEETQEQTEPEQATEPDTPTENEPVDEPETEAPVEAPDEGTPTNSTKKEEITMSQKEDIATDQVIEPKAQASVETAKPNAAAYLKSNKSLEDFARVLAQHAGAEASEVKAGWQRHLTKMEITNPEVLLPEAVVRSIEDAFERGGEIWNLLNKTGLDVYKVAWDTVEGEDSRAKGYNRDVNAEKAEEVITLADRTIRPQFIYKYLTIPKEVVKENRSTGALLQYVLSELPRRIIREVERAVVTGDGRASGSANKITSFTSLKADAAAGNVFAAQYTPGADESHYESVLRAAALVKAEGRKYLVAKSDYLVDVALEQNASGNLLFPPGTDFSRVFNFGGIITPDWMDDDTDNDAYIFVPEQYRTVGDNTIESFTNFMLKTNMNEYLQEIWAGGALSAMNSATAIGSATS